MDAGSHSQIAMASPMPSLGQRRAARIAPLPLGDGRGATVDAGAPTPRTSRSHLLAGLRTAPRTSTATNFPASPTVPASGQQGAFGRSNDNYYNAPRTAHPFSGGGLQQANYDQNMGPPEIRIQDQEQHDFVQMANAMRLAQQQQQIEQQLHNLQLMAAQQQQQFIRHDNGMSTQQQHMLHAQQMQIAQLQNQLAAAQMSLYTYIDPATNQSMYLTPMQMAQLGMDMQMQMQMEQQQQQQLLQHQQAQHQQNRNFRSGSPPKRFEPSVEATPLPPPSANAFRRGHKKAPSLALGSALSVATASDAPRSAGPRTPSFPQSGHGPGQGRAGEHPTRQPRGPPPMEELVAKPTTKHEGSKNFAARARRSAVSSLVRAGIGRRNGSSASSVASASSPTLEPTVAADVLVGSPVLDDSDSERSGSGSLAGDVSLPSSRSSSSSTWGAIGSDRPSSRQKSRKSVDSVDSECECVGSESGAPTGTFAAVFKNAQRASKDSAEGPRKGKLVLMRSGSGNA